MDFSFEHDCDHAPMTVTIEVSCNIWTHPGTYDTPPECSIDNLQYTIKCGDMDITRLIMNEMYDTKLYNEIDIAIENEIWNQYENN
jgi:hypothetical protein